VNYKAGTQDSGLFFCESYENWAVVFPVSRAKAEGFLSPMVTEGSGLQILLLQKGLWAASPISISHLGKKSDFLAVSSDSWSTVTPSRENPVPE
jgi:hypothetical protein